MQIDLAHELAVGVVDADRVGIAGSGPEAGDVKMAVRSPDDPIGPVELSRAAFVVDEDLGFSVAIEAEHGSAQAGGEIARRGIEESIGAEDNAARMMLVVLHLGVVKKRAIAGVSVDSARRSGVGLAAHFGHEPV